MDSNNSKNIIFSIKSSHIINQSEHATKQPRGFGRLDFIGLIKHTE